jgi:hypothetical protein
MDEKSRLGVLTIYQMTKFLTPLQSLSTNRTKWGIGLNGTHFTISEVIRAGPKESRTEN